MYTRYLLYILFIYLHARTEIQTFREDSHCHVILCTVWKVAQKVILVETIRNDDF